MDKYISDLLELIKAHPELPIVPMVDSEIVCDDGCARWMGAWGPASVTKYLVSEEHIFFFDDEDVEAVLMDMEATIAADRYEIETLERALATVRDDPYYRALSGKYLDDVDDRDIAEALECDTSTVWRHRKRLVQRVAVWLYGAEALR